MAGGVSFTFGTITIVVGILALLGGAGVAGYALLDEQDNQDQGLFADPGRTDDNEQLLYAGAAAGALGIILLLISTFLFIVGGIRKSSAAKHAPGIIIAASAPAARGPTVGEVPATRSPKTAMVVGAVGVVVLLLFVGLAFGGVSTFGQVGQALGRDSTAAQSGLLKREQFNRTIKTSYSILGGGQNQDTAHYVEFTTTDATRKLIVNMSWTQTQGGASDLQLIVEKRTGDTWNRLGSVEGRTPQGTELNGDNLASTQIRLRVFAAGNQVVLSQDFSLIVSQWTA